MFKNYFKIAWRNLKKSKLYSFINVGGLAIGMAVAMIIGLWVWDELSFDKFHKNYDRIAQAWQFVKFDAEKSSYNSMPHTHWMQKELRFIGWRVFQFHSCVLDFGREFSDICTFF